MTTGIPTKTRALLRMESLDPEGILLLSRVFLFFANPKNLPRKMPPWLGAGILRWGLTSPGSTALRGGLGDRSSVRVPGHLPFRALRGCSFGG
jgi:hypothetical protein